MQRPYAVIEVKVTQLASVLSTCINGEKDALPQTFAHVIYHLVRWDEGRDVCTLVASLKRNETFWTPGQPRCTLAQKLARAAAAQMLAWCLCGLTGGLTGFDILGSTTDVTSLERAILPLPQHCMAIPTKGTTA